ncbi:MAG TPA: non-ribosomal peptide synthetase, partial [Vicinamibacteria bacterium]
NLMHSTHARLLYYREPVKKFLLLSSFAFDSSVAGIFWTLASGGTLVLPEEGAEKDLRHVMGLVRTHAISHMLCLGSLHDVLLSEGDPRELASLEVAIVAGEACTSDLVARHHERLRGTRLFNEYGPTEATVWCSVYDCADHEGGGAVSIGRPIPNARLYVLDPQRRPVPVGVTGELYVGGPGIARGYHHRPDLTAERFVPDPFGPPGMHLYRTGDSVRFRPDGNLEFLGRLDHQVKLRGFRIELGEIEQVLAGHSAVKAAAVLVKPQARGQGQLAAYLAFKPGPEPTVTELRSFVRERLPEYMVPAVFDFLEELPLNAHGKIDRVALTRAAAASSVENPAPMMPRTPMETLVALTWAEALGLPRVGIKDTFLDLGGHSLLAMKVIARLEERLGLRINPRELLYGTLEQFATSLERGQETPSSPPRDRGWRGLLRGLAQRWFPRPVCFLVLEHLQSGFIPGLT